jgi:DNA gyrase/topoisomerase IV subunit B
MTTDVSIFLIYMFNQKTNHQVQYVYLSHYTTNTNNRNWCLTFNKILKSFKYSIYNNIKTVDKNCGPHSCGISGYQTVNMSQYTKHDNKC